MKHEGYASRGRAMLVALMIVVTMSCTTACSLGFRTTRDGGLDTRPEVDVEDETPWSLDAPDAADGLADALDLIDAVDGRDAVDEEVPGCTMEMASMPRLPFGGLNVSTGPEGDPDQAELLTVGEQVWLMGRIDSKPAATDTPRFDYMPINPSTALPVDVAHVPLGSVVLPARHPTVPLGDSLITVFQDVHGISSNQMMYMVTNMPPSGYRTIEGIAGTSSDSIDPAVASAGDEVMVVWREGLADSMLGCVVVDSTGTVLHGGVATGDGSEAIGQPEIAYGGSAYGIVYFVRRGTGSGRVDFVELDEECHEVSGSTRSWDVMTDHTLVGRPSIEWDGTGYAVMWEESGGSDPHLRFVTMDSSGAHEVSLDPALSGAIGTLHPDRMGMHELAWSGGRYGVVWVYLDVIFARRQVWFFELTRAGELVREPSELHPGSTLSSHPTLEWYQTDTERYYVFAWTEFSSSSGVHVCYTRSFGCSTE